MMKKKYTDNEEQLSRFAKALGHPARIAILKFLIEQDSCFFGDIHEVLPIAKATVSQHLAELKESGLIQGEIMPPKVKYCINKENWQIARGLFDTLFSSYNSTSKKCCE
ncbi:MAG: ArsR/SmtB family transcription factor [Bacteroidales bacterium]